MTKQEEIRGWAFVMLRPICISDEHCEAYVSDLFRGLSERGVVIRVGRELPSWFVNGIDQANKLGKLPVGSGKYVNMLKAGYVAVEPLIKEQ